MPIILVGQHKVILLSLLLGAILGLLYEFYSFLGCVLGFKDAKGEQNKSKIKFFLLLVWDFLYFVVITPVCAIFLYGVNFGIVRWYILLCWLIGFFVYKITIGLILARILNYVTVFIRKIEVAFVNKIKNIFKRYRKNKGEGKKKVCEKREVFSFGIKNNRAK